MTANKFPVMTAAELRTMVDLLKHELDRDWTDETPLEVAQIATNALYWRQREYARLRSALETIWGRGTSGDRTRLQVRNIRTAGRALGYLPK